jgi:pimeloyl-ACP methyl ester carboxylesterase
MRDEGRFEASGAAAKARSSCGTPHAIPIAAVALGLALSASCDRAGTSTSTSSRTTPGSSAAATAVPSSTDLGTVSGRYIRPPQHDRVVIFVNGIFGNGLATWTNSETGKYWPQMLADDPGFQDVDVYVHTFVSPYFKSAQDIGALAARMQDVLQTDRVVETHKQLVFLCHSMGGLITRAYLLAARLPAAKVPMLFFFATPTGGAHIAKTGAFLSDNPQLRDMEPFADGSYVKSLREQWLQTADNSDLNYPQIDSFCAYELRDTWSVRVVPEESAILLCNHGNREVVADHLGIVKPKDERDDPYIYFKAAYERQFGAEAAPIREAFAARLSTPLLGTSRTVTLGRFRSAPVVLKQVKANPQSIEVGCDEEKKGVLEAKVDLAPGESVTEVKADVANTSNLKSSHATVTSVSATAGTATVSYGLRGLDRVAFNCPGGGHGDVIVSFAVTREEPRLRPRLDIPVARDRADVTHVFVTPAPPVRIRPVDVPVRVDPRIRLGLTPTPPSH